MSERKVIDARSTFCPGPLMELIGGMGGTILANNLARRLKNELKTGKAKVTMLSASERHFYQPGLLYVALGRMAVDELYRDQASLLEPGIEFHVDPVEEFNLDNNQVKTKSGKTIDYDYIVIATESRAVAEEIPGLAENSINVYTEEAALNFFKTINQFEGGKVVIAVGVPHKCPMIPPELMFTLYDFFQDAVFSTRYRSITPTQLGACIAWSRSATG